MRVIGGEGREANKIGSMRTLWGGAFEEAPDERVALFGRSIETDLRFWREDVLGSIAHARMLGQTGILTPDESDRLVAGLEQILSEGAEHLPTDVEDIHTAVEVRLGEIVGEVAGKLHTARSRNDQVATDFRLYLRGRLVEVKTSIKALQAELLSQARRTRTWIMPGVTHMQPAQPITLGFHLMAIFWALQRHGRRAEWVEETIGLCPLGSAALAGTNFRIDRHLTAHELGFRGPAPNALDATSDRSFALDALHLLVQIGLDMSRTAQEFVLWCSPPYGYLRLADAVTTGSSIMPQKRNPDMAELIRGRSAQLIGAYTAMAAMIKGLPLGYNRDTQDDKPPLFTALDLTIDMLELTRTMLAGAKWDRRRLESGAAAGFSLATDLANRLAQQGMPFREAHEVVGGLARAYAAGGDQALGEAAAQAGLSVDLTPRASVAARESFGAPGPHAMGVQLRRAAALHRRVGFAQIA